MCSSDLVEGRRISCTNKRLVRARVSWLISPKAEGSDAAGTETGRGVALVMESGSGIRSKIRRMGLGGCPGSTHGLFALGLGVSLAGHRKLGIHQGATRGLQVDIIEAGAALGQGEDGEIGLRQLMAQALNDR